MVCGESSAGCAAVTAAWTGSRFPSIQCFLRQAAAFVRKPPVTIHGRMSYVSKQAVRSGGIKLLLLKYVTGSERMWHPAAVQLFTASVSLHKSMQRNKSLLCDSTAHRTNQTLIIGFRTCRSHALCLIRFAGRRCKFMVSTCYKNLFFLRQKVFVMICQRSCLKDWSFLRLCESNPASVVQC